MKALLTLFVTGVSLLCATTSDLVQQTKEIVYEIAEDLIEINPSNESISFAYKQWNNLGEVVLSAYRICEADLTGDGREEAVEAMYELACFIDDVIFSNPALSDSFAYCISCTECYDAPHRAKLLHVAHNIAKHPNPAPMGQSISMAVSPDATSIAFLQRGVNPEHVLRSWFTVHPETMTITKGCVAIGGQTSEESLFHLCKETSATVTGTGKKDDKGNSSMELSGGVTHKTEKDTEVEGTFTYKRETDSSGNTSNSVEGELKVSITY